MSSVVLGVVLAFRGVHQSIDVLENTVHVIRAGIEYLAAYGRRELIGFA